MSERTPQRRIGRARETLVAGIAFLVHSNVFIAIGATGVAVTTVLLADLQLDHIPLFIVFAATLFVYGLDRFTDREADARNVPGRASFVRRYGRFWLATGTALYAAAVVLAVVVDVPGAPYLVLPLLVAVVYSVARVKRVLLVKNLLVGFAWSAVPLGVGVYYDVLASVEVLFLAAFFFVMLTVAAILFDVKDLEGDRAQGVSTVPLVVGPRPTRVACAVVTVAVAVAVTVAVALGPLDVAFLVLLAYLGYVLAYTPYATHDRGSLFYGFVVDGEHVFLAALVVVVELL